MKKHILIGVLGLLFAIPQMFSQNSLANFQESTYSNYPLKGVNQLTLLGGGSALNGYQDYSVPIIGLSSISFESISPSFNNETPVAPSFRLYPNPVLTVLMIESGSQFNWIHIFNSSGNLVYSSQGISSISMENFPADLYFIRAMSGNQVYGGSFLKK